MRISRRRSTAVELIVRLLLRRVGTKWFEENRKMVMLVSAFLSFLCIILNLVAVVALSTATADVQSTAWTYGEVSGNATTDQACVVAAILIFDLVVLLLGSSALHRARATCTCGWALNPSSWTTMDVSPTPSGQMPSANETSVMIANLPARRQKWQQSWPSSLPSQHSKQTCNDRLPTVI